MAINEEKATNGVEPVISSTKWHDWLDAIRLNSVADALSVLESCEVNQVDMLVNGRFDYLESQPFQMMSVHLPDGVYCTHPVVIAATLGSTDVLRVLLDRGADPLIREQPGGHNIVHTLILISALDPKAEQRMATIYRRLTDSLPVGVQKELLAAENDAGLRPIELAAKRGCVRLLRSILDTGGVYLKYELDIGLDRYRWYDVTEYETRERLDKSPLLFLAMSAQSTFLRPDFVDFMHWQAVRQWCRSKTASCVPLMFVWFLIRLVYTVSHVTIASDSLSVTGRSDVTGNRSDNDSLAFCPPEDDRFILGPGVRQLMVYYVIVHSAAIILFDVIELATAVTRMSYYLPRDRLAERFIFLTHAVYRVNQFVMAIGVVVLYAIYLTGADGGAAGSARPVLELLTVFTVYISMAFFVLVMPYVGFQLIIVHQLVSQLFAFLVLYMMMLLPFSTFFMAYMNANTEQGCIEEFRNILNSVYSSILLMLNMVDLTDYVTVHQGFLLLVHVIFVFIIGMLMINFLIAIMTNKAGNLMEHEHVMMDIYLLCLGILLEMRFSSVLKSYYNREKRKRLVFKEGRYYVIDVLRLAACN